MATPLKDILNAAEGKDRSVQWYVDAVQQYARGLNSFQEAKQSDLGKVARQLTVGKMYMFSYDPKGKADLPYYDTCPLVIIAEPLATGFSGINLHYLHPAARAELLDKITMRRMPWDQDMDQSEATMRANWSFIKNFSRFPEVRGSVKKYLTQMITGQMIEVDYRHWKSALFLPVQNFVGASANEVYKETMATKPRKKGGSINA